MSNFPGIPLSNISGERANFGGAFRRVENELIPYSSAANTFDFEGRDLIIKDSLDSVNLRSLFAYIGSSPLADELGSAGTAVLGADVTVDSGELLADGEDPEVYIDSIANGFNFSIIGRIRFDSTADSNIDIMSLSNSTNSVEGTQHLRIYKFNDEIRFEIEDDTDVRNFVIADDTDVLNSNYITYWIIRNGNQIRVIIENIFDNIWGLNAQNVMYNLYMFSGNGGATVGRISTNASINETLTDNEINNVTGLINQNPDILAADFIVDFDFTIKRTMNMDNRRITNMAQPELAGDAANKAYVDNATGGSDNMTELVDNSSNVMVDTSSGTVVQVANKRIAGVLQPDAQNDAANKAYVENWEPAALEETDGVARMEIKTLNDPIFDNPCNTLSNGSGNNGRLALASSGSIRMVFGNLDGFQISAKGGKGSLYHDTDGGNSVANLTVQENDTIFNKDINVDTNKLLINNAGKLQIGAELLSSSIDNSRLTDLNGFIFDENPTFGISANGESTGRTASLLFGTNGYSTSDDILRSLKGGIIFQGNDSWARGDLCLCVNRDTEDASFDNNVSLDDTRFRINGQDGGIDCLDKLNMDDNKITNCADPDNDQDVATKNYVDTEISSKESKWNNNGTTATLKTPSDISLENNRITNCDEPVDNTDVANKFYIYNREASSLRFFANSGGTVLSEKKNKPNNIFLNDISNPSTGEYTIKIGYQDTVNVDKTSFSIVAVNEPQQSSNRVIYVRKFNDASVAGTLEIDLRIRDSANNPANSGFVMQIKLDDGDY